MPAIRALPRIVELGASVHTDSRIVSIENARVVPYKPRTNSIGLRIPCPRGR